MISVYVTGFDTQNYECIQFIEMYDSFVYFNYNWLVMRLSSMMLYGMDVLKLKKSMN